VGDIPRSKMNDEDLELRQQLQVRILESCGFSSRLILSSMLDMTVRLLSGALL
jgi:hypothetical protein